MQARVGRPIRGRTVELPQPAFGASPSHPLSTPDSLCMLPERFWLWQPDGQPRYRPRVHMTLQPSVALLRLGALCNHLVVLPCMQPPSPQLHRPTLVPFVTVWPFSSHVLMRCSRSACSTLLSCPPQWLVQPLSPRRSTNTGGTCVTQGCSHAHTRHITVTSRSTNNEGTGVTWCCRRPLEPEQAARARF